MIGVDRRGFFRIAGLVTAGLALSSCAQRSPTVLPTPTAQPLSEKELLDAKRTMVEYGFPKEYDIQTVVSRTIDVVWADAVATIDMWSPYKESKPGYQILYAKDFLPVLREKCKQYRGYTDAELETLPKSEKDVQSTIACAAIGPTIYIVRDAYDWQRLGSSELINDPDHTRRLAYNIARALPDFISGQAKPEDVPNPIYPISPGRTFQRTRYAGFTSMGYMQADLEQTLLVMDGMQRGLAVILAHNLFVNWGVDEPVLSVDNFNSALVVQFITQRMNVTEKKLLSLLPSGSPDTVIDLFAKLLSGYSPSMEDAVIKQQAQELFFLPSRLSAGPDNLSLNAVQYIAYLITEPAQHPIPQTQEQQGTLFTGPRLSKSRCGPGVRWKSLARAIAAL